MEDFAGDACRTVIAQICEAVGFHSMTHSASETLTDVLIKFIDEMGFQAHSLAEFSGRTEANILDVRLAIEQMNLSIPELYVQYPFSNRFMQRNELRYAKAETQFPVVKAPRPRTRFGQQDESEPLPPHIPSFLPPFPPRHTYASTPAAADGKGDPRTAKKQRNKQRRQLEGSLLKLHHAEKKKKTHPKFGAVEGAEQEEAEPAVDATKVSGEAVQSNPALTSAVMINEVLADTEHLKTITALDPAAAKALPPPADSAPAVVKPFAISLPSSDAMAIKDAGDGSTRDDRDRDRKRQKAVKILATTHDLDGEKQAAGEAAGEAARSPANPGDDGGDPMADDD